MGARRVELDCAGPPHWRGSPPFSGANAGSAHSARRAVSCLCRFSLSLVSVSCLCRFSLSLSLLLSLFLFSVSFLCHFSSLFSHHSFTASHTLTRHSSPRVHPAIFHLTFPCCFPCRFSLSLFHCRILNGIPYCENVLSGTRWA